MEPAGYDRDRAQDMLEMYRQRRTPPDRWIYFGLGLSVDANFQGTATTPSIGTDTTPPIGTDTTPSIGTDTPPIILLNFMYGVAAYKRWRSPPGVGIIKAYFEEHYKHISVPRPRAPSGESESPSYEDTQEDPNDPDNAPDNSTQEDPNDPDYVPDNSSMVAAMDELDMVLMYIRGITPEEAAIRWEKRLKEEEQMAQEAGRRKVMEWIDTVRT